MQGVGRITDARPLTLILLLLTTSPMPAIAQEQTHAPALFGQFASELTVGDRVTVVDREGRAARGELILASATTLRIEVDGQPRNYAAPEVQAVYSRSSRAMRGALIGLAVGAALGVVAASRVSASAGGAVGGSTFFGGIGAGAGAAIGAGFFRDREIYRAPPGGAPNLPADQQAAPNLARPRPDLKWAASVVVGTTSSGPASDLEDAMRAAHFDENRGTCVFGLCFPGTNHPFSRTGFSVNGFPWTVSGRRWLSSWYGVGLSGGFSEIGTTFGERRDSGEFLDLQYSVATVAPMLIIRPAHGLHTGIGPAFFTSTFTKTSLPNADQAQTRRNAGLLWEAGISLPPRSRVFGEVLVQYRRVGRVDVGPFDATNGITTATLPRTNVSMNHWFAGVGAGIRF